MVKLNITNEVNKLRSVVLGSCSKMKIPMDVADTYDPKSKKHLLDGTFPTLSDIDLELDGFEKALKKYDVTVYRPHPINNQNQIFVRDIGFVIDDKIIEPKILKYRKEEIKGIDYLKQSISKNQIIQTPNEVNIEGGDVMPCNDYIFIGYSKKMDFEKYVVSRTNQEGVEFIKEKFSNWKVKAFELKKSDDDPYNNALHLDCIFQPVGEDKAIIHKEGFKNPDDYRFLKEYFGEENLFHIKKEEMYHMMSNIFSISPNIVVSEKNFTRLNNQLRKWGMVVEEISFGEIAKMEGLLRCSTLPLFREENE